MGSEGVGSVKWALEGHGDPLKHLILAEGTAGQGKWAAYLNGAETGIR